MDIILERILDCIGLGHGSAKELADALGINPQIITNWRCGSSKSYRKYLNQIAKHYHVSMGYLLGNEEKPTAQSGEPDILDEVDIGFYGEYKELDEDDKESVRDFVRIMRERREKRKRG